MATNREKSIDDETDSPIATVYEPATHNSQSIESSVCEPKRRHEETSTEMDPDGRPKRNERKRRSQSYRPRVGASTYRPNYDAKPEHPGCYIANANRKRRNKTSRSRSRESHRDSRGNYRSSLSPLEDHRVRNSRWEHPTPRVATFASFSRRYVEFDGYPRTVAPYEDGQYHRNALRLHGPASCNEYSRDLPSVRPRMRQTYGQREGGWPYHSDYGSVQPRDYRQDLTDVYGPTFGDNSVYNPSRLEAEEYPHRALAPPHHQWNANIEPEYGSNRFPSYRENTVQQIHSQMYGPTQSLVYNGDGRNLNSSHRHH